MTEDGARRFRLAPAGTGGAIGGALIMALAGGLPALLTGALGVQLRQDLGFGVAGLGAAVAVYSGAATLGAGALGEVADRIGWRRALRLASLLVVGSLLGTALVAGSWPVLALFLALGGLGHATGLPAGNLAIAATVRHDRRAMVLGLRQAGVPAAGLLAGLSVPLLATTLGWRWAYIAGLCAPLLVLVLVAGRDETAPTRSGAASPVRQGWSRLGFHKPEAAFAVFLGAPFIGAGLVNATTTFVVTSLVEFGFSIGIAGLCFTLGNLVGMLTRALAGIAVSRRRSEGFVPLAMMLIVGAGGFVLLAIGRDGSSLLGVVLVFAGATGWPGLSHFIAVSRNPDRVGAASGLMMTGAFLGGTLGPLGFGLLAEMTSLGVSWTVCAALSALAGILVLTSCRLYRRSDVTHTPIYVHRIASTPTIGDDDELG